TLIPYTTLFRSCILGKRGHLNTINQFNQSLFFNLGQKHTTEPGIFNDLTKAFDFFLLSFQSRLTKTTLFVNIHFQNWRSMFLQGIPKSKFLIDLYATA